MLCTTLPGQREILRIVRKTEVDSKNIEDIEKMYFSVYQYVTTTVLDKAENR
jgi:hypothetical protein